MTFSVTETLAASNEAAVEPLRPAIIVNLAANNNSAARKWNRIRTDLLCTMPQNCHVVEYRPPFDLSRCIRELSQVEQVNCFIAAGGDGTLNYVLNAAIEVFGLNSRRVCIGAIGLGSSNDYHKPFRRTCRGIPIRTDLARCVWSDIGIVNYTLGATHMTRYFLTGASIGLIAEANDLFNRGDVVIRRLKHRALELTIGYAALKTMLTFKNHPLTIEYDGIKKNFDVTNLSVIKSVHVSGGLQYDLAIYPDDGLLGINLCYSMDLIQRLGVFYDLMRKQFSGKPKRIALLTRSASVRAETAFALETDGELQQASSADFSVAHTQVSLLC
jgi:diacylglycerol kinase (ATP)